MPFKISALDGEQFRFNHLFTVSCGYYKLSHADQSMVLPG